jgi:hypothetical protein
MGSSGCGAGAVPSKQAKQTSKGLVFDAVRVRVLNKEDKVEWKDTTYPPILYVLPTQT